MGIGSILSAASGDSSFITLYHGTSAVFDNPIFGKGKSDNDYGSGFYLTPSFDRAAEWACEFGDSEAYVNEYRLPLSNLSVLDLDSLGPLAWIAEVGSHRYVPIGWVSEFFNLFVDMYKPDTNYDVLIGQRADDTYMSVLSMFFEDKFGAFEIERMFLEGDLGVQYFIKSEKSFDAIKFVKRSKVSGKSFDDSGFRIKNKNKMSERDRQLFLNKSFAVPFPTMLNSIDRLLVYNKEGHYYE